MSIKISLLFVLLSSTLLTAYQDYDIDGVEDYLDKCPNTPFDKLVDERGCSKDSSFYGKLILMLGYDSSFDKSSTRVDSKNMYVNYRYNSFDLSFSNSTYSIYENRDNILNATADSYISCGYFFKLNSLESKASIGSKVATGDERVSTGENDFFLSYNATIHFNHKQNIFLYLDYTIVGDSNEVDYKNTFTYSFGSGYTLSNSWYSSIYYEQGSSIHSNTQTYKSISLFNRYSFTEKFFSTLNYAYNLDDVYYSHALSLNLGVHF